MKDVRGVYDRGDMLDTEIDGPTVLREDAERVFNDTSGG